MHSSTRRQFLASLPAGILGSLMTSHASASSSGNQYRGLPWNTVFVGEDKFQSLCAQAQRGQWAQLPIGQRTCTVGRALLGVSYGNYTLEIHDRIESPSANLRMLDCWTFYEISLAFARMIRSHPAPWQATELLHFIELERYRGGKCDGTYLSRMHQLEEVFYDNERRGLGTNVTRSLGGVRVERNVREMQIAWKQYRYLRNNPSLLSGIAKVESRVSNLPVTYIPRNKVAGIEHLLRDGDVLAIASYDETAYTSHVGLALRKGDTCRFMHATSSRDKGRCCVVDTRISQYLTEKSSNMGLIVFRPGEASA